jgi:hypothetical protein
MGKIFDFLFKCSPARVPPIKKFHSIETCDFCSKMNLTGSKQWFCSGSPHSPYEVWQDRTLWPPQNNGCDKCEHHVYTLRGYLCAHEENIKIQIDPISGNVKFMQYCTTVNHDNLCQLHSEFKGTENEN